MAKGEIEAYAVNIEDEWFATEKNSEQINNNEMQETRITIKYLRLFDIR